MKLLLVLLTLTFVACGKKSASQDAAYSCTPDISGLMATFPDGAYKATSIEACSDGTYKVSSLSDAAKFSHASPMELTNQINQTVDQIIVLKIEDGVSHHYSGAFLSHRLEP